MEAGSFRSVSWGLASPTSLLAGGEPPLGPFRAVLQPPSLPFSMFALVDAVVTVHSTW